MIGISLAVFGISIAAVQAGLIRIAIARLGEATTVEIDREYRKKKDGLTASDHAPVWVDLA